MITKIPLPAECVGDGERIRLHCQQGVLRHHRDNDAVGVPGHQSRAADVQPLRAHEEVARRDAHATAGEVAGTHRVADALLRSSLGDVGDLDRVEGRIDVNVVAACLRLELVGADHQGCAADVGHLDDEAQRCDVAVAHDGAAGGALADGDGLLLELRGQNLHAELRSGGDGHDGDGARCECRGGSEHSRGEQRAADGGQGCSKGRQIAAAAHCGRDGGRVSIADGRRRSVARHWNRHVDVDDDRAVDGGRYLCWNGGRLCRWSFCVRFVRWFFRRRGRGAGGSEGRSERGNGCHWRRSRFVCWLVCRFRNRFEGGFPSTT